MVLEWSEIEDAELLQAVISLGLDCWDEILANNLIAYNQYTQRTAEEIREHFFYLYPDSPVDFRGSRTRGRVAVYWATWVAKYQGTDRAQAVQGPIAPQLQTWSIGNLQNVARNACRNNAPRLITALGVHMRARFNGNGPMQFIIPVWQQQEDNTDDPIDRTVGFSFYNGDTLLCQRSLRSQLNCYPHILTSDEAQENQ